MDLEYDDLLRVFYQLNQLLKLIFQIFIIIPIFFFCSSQELDEFGNFDDDKEENNNEKNEEANNNNIDIENNKNENTNNEEDPFGDIPMSEAPKIEQEKDLLKNKDKEKMVLESPVNIRKATVVETLTTIIAKVIFPSHYPVKQKTVGIQKDTDISGAIKSIANMLMKQNNYQIKDVGLCVQPMEHHPVEFKLLKCYPFFPENESVAQYKEIFMKEPIYLREKVLKDNKLVGVVRLRVKFPSTFPFVYKTFDLQTNLNVREAIEQIAKNLLFKAATVANIGLRIPRDFIHQGKSEEIKRIQNTYSKTFPFLDSNTPLTEYVTLIHDLVKKKKICFFSHKKNKKKRIILITHIQKKNPK